MNTDPSKDELLKRKLEETLWEYQTTPRGQNDIRRAAMFEEDPTKKAQLEALLAKAVETREKQLEAYRAVKMRGTEKEPGDLKRSQRRGTTALSAYADWFGDDPETELIEEDTLATKQGKFLILGMKYTARNIRHASHIPTSISKDFWEYPVDESESTHYWNEFTKHLTDKGYVGIALTHLISDEVWFLDWDAAEKALNVRYKLRPKVSGTNPWNKSLRELRKALRGTPVSHLTFTEDEKHKFVSELTTQFPKRQLSQGEVYLQVIEKTDDGYVKYAPRKRSLPGPDSNTLMVELTAKDETFGSGVSESFANAVKEPVLNNMEIAPEQVKETENTLTTVDGPPKPLYIS